MQESQDVIEYRSLLVCEIKALEKLLPCNTYLNSSTKLGLPINGTHLSDADKSDISVSLLSNNNNHK